MQTILLNIKSHLQSWGVGCTKTERNTECEPTKSAIIGLLCAAIGKSRDDDSIPTLADISVMKMGVLVVKSGDLCQDYVTVGSGINKPTINNQLDQRTIILHKYYLMDAAFVVGLESDNSSLLQLFKTGLLNPKWQLFFGRKCCVPSEPIFKAIINKSLRESLIDCANISQNTEKRLILECEYDNQDGFIRYDVPISFKHGDRQFGTRKVVECYVP